MKLMGVFCEHPVDGQQKSSSIIPMQISILRNRHYRDRWNGIHSTNRIHYTIITPGLLGTVNGASALTFVESLDTSYANKVQTICGTAPRQAGLTSIGAAGPAPFESWRRKCGHGDKTCKDDVLFHGQLGMICFQVCGRLVYGEQ